MQTYNEFERQRNIALKEREKIDMECIHCPNCSSQWFMEIPVYKFQANHNVILGQNVPTKPGAIPYYILQCVRCKDLLEPRVIHTTRDIGGNDYDDFLDTLDGKGDLRKNKEEVKELLQTIEGLKQRIEMLESDRVVVETPVKTTKKKLSKVSPTEV